MDGATFRYIKWLKVLNLENRTAMIISDLDYLGSIPETSAIYLNGGDAIAISGFVASAYGSSTSTGTVLNNLVISRPSGSVASSSIKVTAIASGLNVFATASASSTSVVS